MADTIEKPARDAGYDTDFYLWTQQQAAALRDAARMRINAPIDWENVAEEVESLGKSDRRAIQSLSYQLIVHLLKLRTVERSEPRNGWKNEVRNYRRQIERVLADSPSLRAQFASLAEDEWPSAIKEVSDLLEEEYGQSANELRTLVYLKLLGPNFKRLLDSDFFPEPASE